MKRSFRRRGARLGQHFLTNAHIARDVAKAAKTRAGDTVLEVGPGKGILTREALSLGARVVAVEKDEALIKRLREGFEKEIRDGRLEPVLGDIRDYLKKGRLRAPYKVVANIPYYLTGELIRTLLTAEEQPSDVALLVQKEVAERIARSKKESILSLSVKAYGKPRYIKTVKAGSFNPAPSVDSAILSIENISHDALGGVSEAVFFETVRRGFSQKRKTLFGNLKTPSNNEALGAFWSEHRLDRNVRAEDVPLPIWLSLAGALQEA